MSEFKDKVAVVTGGAIVNISSSRDRMSQAQTESYTAAKGGISALTHASGRVGNPMDIANAVFFLLRGGNEQSIFRSG